MMFTIRDWVRMAGIFVFLAGLSCMPFPISHIKQLLSIWPLLAASGAVIRLGIACMLVGVALFAVSYVPWFERSRK